MLMLLIMNWSQVIFIQYNILISNQLSYLYDSWPV